MKRHLQLGLKQLTASYANGSLCPKLVTDYALEDAVKLKSLNAFIRLTPEKALHQAKESAHRYNEKKALGPLDGATVAIKDNFCTKGVHTTCASKMLENFVPPYESTVTERLQSAGAVMIGKTNMDQFGMGSGTVDSIYGPTKNIWSEDLSGENWRIAGGSSGGSANAVAAGICFAAIGSDTGGSTRNPASYCGVVGLKPTYGLVSRHGLIPLVNSMDVPGIITRSVEDCALILNAIAGPDDYDSTTIKEPYLPIKLPQLEEIDIRKLRIGIPKEYHCEGLSPEVVDTWRLVADMLQQDGAQVCEVSMPNTEHSIIVYSILNHCEVSSNMARYDGIRYGHRAEVGPDASFEELVSKTREEGFNDVVKSRIITGNYYLLNENYEKFFLKALKVRGLIIDDFNKVFHADNEKDRVDILLTPTTLSDAPLYKDFIAMSNNEQCAFQDFCTQSANMAGVPAITLPIRLSSNGLPLSLQLMSRTLSEGLLLTVAKWIEARVAFDCMENKQIYEARK